MAMCGVVVVVVVMCGVGGGRFVTVGRWFSWNVGGDGVVGGGDGRVVWRGYCVAPMSGPFSSSCR